MAINPPFDFRAKSVEPYSPSVKLPAVEEENDVGLSTRRRRSSNPIIVHNMNLEMTWEEFWTLSEWVNTSLFGAVFSFYFTPPHSAQVKTGRFVLSEGKWYSGLNGNRLFVTISVQIEETID